MKQEKHELETIFWKAIDIPSPSKLAEYLDNACGQDTELRTRVEKLIAAHPHARCFLEEPSHLADISQSMHPQEKPGDILGDYKIVKQIGEGGMGIVYMAEQLQPVKRKVALKIIKVGMDSQQILSRFEAERQTLALMDHPNIARVFDAGQIENGRPYFVMELVDGIPMTDFCDRNNLDTEKKLELFSELCHGLQHAHQKGIIHRDLKPSNVLVTFIDNEPVPKIIDFGVSKALDRDSTEQTLFTTFGQLVGTPLYMSPEQAALSGNDIDTRSDIYSMGVVLYELLTGSTPFDKNTLAKAGYDEMRRMIREDEPAKPSSRISTLEADNESVSIDRDTDMRHLTKILRHDLDWIVMKALEKERDRRYQTVADFAQDIDRFLDHQPVEARPPSTVYRLKKYCKRNKTFVTASVIVVIAILSGSGVSIWQAVIAHQRFLSEKTARAEVEQERERAALALIQTRKTIDNYVKTVQNAELLKDSRFRPLMKELLKDALKHYQSLINTFEMDNESLLELSDAFYQIGLINGRIGENETAMVAYHKSIDIREKLIAKEPDRLAYQTRLAASYHNVGSFYDQKGEFDEALNFFQKATESWSRLAALDPKNLQFQRNLAASHNNVGDTFFNQGKMQEAMERFMKSKSIIDEIVKLEPSTTSFREILVTTLNNIGRSYRNIGKTEKALEHYRKAATNAEYLIEESSGERDHYQLLSTTLNEIGTLLSETGKLQDSINTLEKALEISEELVRKFPTEIFYENDLASLHNNLANVYAKVKRNDLATKSFRRSMVLCEKLVNEDPVNIAYQSKLATIQNNLGNQFSRNKDFVTAEKYLKKGL